MSADDLLSRILQATNLGPDVELIRRVPSLVESEAREISALQLDLGKRAAEAASKPVVFTEVDTPDLFGFYECCVEDATTNGYLCLRTAQNRWRVFTFGCQAVPVDPHKFLKDVTEAVTGEPL